MTSWKKYIYITMLCYLEEQSKAVIAPLKPEYTYASCWLRGPYIF